MFLLIDIAIILSAFLAAVLWIASSRSRLRRVAKTEEFDYHDMNRLVVTFNRAQRLNARAALATGLSVFLVAVRFSLLTLMNMG